MPYVSYERRLVPMKYIFCAVVYQTDNSFVSLPINAPKRYAAYERGRALIMYNVSYQTPLSQTPTIINTTTTGSYGHTYYNSPVSTADQTKELLDAYFETFHDVTYDAVRIFTEMCNSYNNDTISR